MKYLKQFTVIMIVSMIGEFLHALIPLPVPASIYGLVLMLAGLLLRVIPYESVNETAHFLISIMAVMFVPAGVGLMTSYDTIRPLILPFMIISIVSTIFVMGVGGRVTQAMIRRKESGRK